MDFERMRTIRKAKNKTQEDLAKYLGVNRATVSKYESGVIEPSLTQISRIAAFLEVPQGDILGLEAFDTPAEYEKRWAELTGTPHNVDPIKTIPLVSAKEFIIRSFDLLNDRGQWIAVQRIEELTKIPDYQRTETPDNK